MKKESLLIFLSGVLSVICLAQNKHTDSLKRMLAAATTDTTRVELTAELGLQYRNANPDSSIYYCTQALTLARKIGFKRGEALAICHIGLAMREKGDLPKCLELALQALEIAEANNYIFEKALAFRRIGLVYMDLRDYPMALDYLYRTLHLNESIHNRRGIGIEHMNVGMNYEYMGNTDSALVHIQQAEELKNNIEDLYPEVNRVFGNIYARRGQTEKALLYYHKGIDAALKLNDFRTTSFIHADVAGMFRRINARDSSIAYAKKGVEYGQKASYKKGILFSATILSELYDPVNTAEALRYYKIAAAAKDSLFGAGNIKTIETLIASEQAKKKEIETQKASYQNRLKQYGFITAIIVFSIIAFILYRNNQQKQKANKVLKSTLTDLKSTQSQLIQSEKMASLGELTAGIAHEIQNPLNFVNNFSELSGELIDEAGGRRQEAGENSPEVGELLTDIKENLSKINHHGKRADAIVKGMLQHSQRNSGEKEPTDINALADEYLRLSYHGLLSKNTQDAAHNNFNASIKTDFDSSVGRINLIPQDIGRVLLNLYNNAFYAVREKQKQKTETGESTFANATADKYQPEVSVSTKRNGNRVEITVKDNGNGIPERIRDKIFQPFFTTKPTGQGTGLGLSLSYDIVKAHGGELKVESTVSGSTEFTVVLPG